MSVFLLWGSMLLINLDFVHLWVGTWGSFKLKLKSTWPILAPIVWNQALHVHMSLIPLFLFFATHVWKAVFLKQVISVAASLSPEVKCKQVRSNHSWIPVEEVLFSLCPCFYLSTPPLAHNWKSVSTLHLWRFGSEKQNFLSSVKSIHDLSRLEEHAPGLL